jgi:hypothetical protein
LGFFGSSGFSFDWGSTEASRLLPVLAGCAAVLMAWPAALTVLRPVEALVVTGYLAFSQDLIAASSQVKPYSLDVFISLFLLWCTVPLFDEQPTRQKLSTAAIGGSLAIWFSFPAIFVMVGFAVALLISILRSRHRNSLWSILPVLLLWATSAGLAYWFSFRPGLLNLRLAAADANYQFPIYSLNIAFGWLFTALRAIAATMTSVRLAPVAVVALITAIVIALSRRDTVAAVLGAPAILCLLASVAQCYPWFPRLLFFLVPLLAILIVSEIGWLVRANLLSMRRPVVAVAVAGLTYSCVSAIKNVGLHPTGFDDPRSAVAAIVAAWQPGDGIYASDAGMPPLLYYARSAIAHSSMTFVSPRKPMFQSDEQELMPALRAVGRVWFIYFDPTEHNFDQRTLAHFGRSGRLLRSSQYKNYIISLWSIGTGSSKFSNRVDTERRDNTSQ